MTKSETNILLRLEEKIDKLDYKFDSTMERYVIPHEEFIKNYKEEKNNKFVEKENKIARSISIGIALLTSLIAIGIAILK